MSQAQKQKPRLGRGLSSLISMPTIARELPVEAPPGESQAVADNIAASMDAAPATTVAGQPADVPIGEIVPNPYQPRKVFSEASLAELAASIRATGMVQPVILRRAASGYQIIAGERRWRAAQKAGLTALPAIIREVDAFEQAQMALVENIQREDLNPIDRAQAYRALIDQLGLTQAELANRLGEDRSSVANFLRLLELPDAVREMVRDGRVSFGHAKLLAGVSDVLEQQRLAELVIAQGLSVRNLERVIQHPKTDAPPARAEKGGSAHLADLEKSLARQLGMRVQVKASSQKGKGRVILHYSTLDQFDDLLARLGATVE